MHDSLGVKAHLDDVPVFEHGFERGERSVEGHALVKEVVGDRDRIGGAVAGEKHSLARHVERRPSLRRSGDLAQPRLVFDLFCVGQSQPHACRRRAVIVLERIGELGEVVIEKFLFESDREHRLEVRLEHSGIDRTVGVDRREFVREIGKVLVLFQLFAQLALDLVQVGVHPVQSAVAVQQALRRLFADSGHAGDVVGRVAHQRFEVDDLRRREPVILFELCLVHQRDLGDALDREHDLCAAVDQLPAVAVACDDEYVAVKLARERADQIVRLVAVHFAHRNAHQRKHVLDRLQLCGEVFRHGLARRLVALVHLLAEGGRLAVERGDDLVRLKLRDQLGKHRKVAVDRPGGTALAVGERAHRVIRAVEQRVGIEQNESRHGNSPIFDLKTRLCDNNVICAHLRTSYTPMSTRFSFFNYTLFSPFCLYLFDFVRRNLL